ncbi:peptidoglycan editing factor PgeF [Aurantimonas sp. VKM B-3413]|uniref:peptidoglycan editing factor PgeF n=1 Tax=Aurantimonas sp. VKM B-3413 TaxID=2779401 RepID=UPI001E4C3900|nr:peptidoglycan editing factor PgeF [Aurantimonas sp. VKM B-3413]MCB8836890.1 peptidoglycan editing factor PgeF [Aurantimonas sp. VKM B-3413]
MNERSTAPALGEADVIRADSLASERLSHAFFTRRGGVSGGLYAGLNVGIGSSDDPADVTENRARAMVHLGLDPSDLVTPWQVHSAEAIVVEAPFAGERPKVDGIVTNRPGLGLGVVTADCGPVLFADAAHGVIGAAHAGWRGALGGVLQATVAAMEDAGARRESITAVLGPTITQPNYQVGLDMMREFVRGDPQRERFFAPGETPDRRQFDLPGFILSVLSATGVSAEFVGHCTYGDADAFFSFRRTTHRGEPDYGRQLAAITLRD